MSRDRFLKGQESVVNCLFLGSHSAHPSIKLKTLRRKRREKIEKSPGEEVWKSRAEHVEQFSWFSREKKIFLSLRMCVCRFLSLSICPFLSLTFCLCLSVICLSLSVSLSVCLSLYLSQSLSLTLSLPLYLFLSRSLSLSLAISLFNCLSIYLAI